MHSHFFSKKYQNICVSLDVNFNKSLTNDIVSFEQLGSALVKNPGRDMLVCCFFVFLFFFFLFCFVLFLKLFKQDNMMSAQDNTKQHNIVFVRLIILLEQDNILSAQDNILFGQRIILCA